MYTKKPEFKWKMIKRDVLRHWPIWVTSFIVYVFAVFLVNSFARGFMSTVTPYEVTTTIIGSLIELTHFMAFCMGMLAAWASFGFLGKKKKDFFYEALPFSRLSLYVNKYLFGMIICLLPCFTMFFIELFQILVLSGSFEIVLLLKWLITAIIEYAFWYSLAVLFMVLCGRFMMAVSCYLVFSFLGIGLRFFLEISNAFCFVGVSNGFGDGNSVLGVFSPIEYINSIEITFFRIDYNLNETSNVFMDGAAGKYVVIFITGILIAVVSYLLYTKRKEERTEDNIVFNGMKIVFSSIVTFFGNIYLATITYLIIFYNNDNRIAHKPAERVKLIILVAVIGFFGYLISSMIVEKKLKIFKSHCLKALIFTVIISLIGIGYLHDVFNIEGYVPDTEDIDYININAHDSIYKELYKTTGKERSVIKIYNKETIKVITEIHEIITDNIEDIVNTPYNQGLDYYSFHFTYELKNGSTVSRSYSVREKSGLFNKLQEYIMENIDVLAAGIEPPKSNDQPGNVEKSSWGF